MVDALHQNNVPEVLLILMGIVAILVVFFYRDDKESKTYKAMVAVGVAMGAFMVYVAVFIGTGWTMGTLIILTLGCFALIVRPFRDINLAVVAGLIVAVWVYLCLPGAVTGIEPPLDFLDVFADGTPRLILSVFAGAIVYLLLKFISDAVLLFGKILNAWPFLMFIGVWSIVEGIFIIMGYGSIYDFFASAGS